MNCIFCKISNKEIPGTIIYEDEYILAFTDLYPLQNGHILLIPKQHVENEDELNDDIILHLHKTSHKLINAITDSLNIPDFTIMHNIGKVQEIKHFHLHIVPRVANEIEYNLLGDSSQIIKLAEKIKNELY